MIWLAAHMWMLLLTAFAIGLGVGWWIWGARETRALPAPEETPMGTLDSDFPAAPEDASPQKD